MRRNPAASRGALRLRGLQHRKHPQHPQSRVRQHLQGQVLQHLQSQVLQHLQHP